MRNPRKKVALLLAALTALATLTLSGTDSTLAAGSARQAVAGHGGGDLCGTDTTPDCPFI